MTEYKARRAHIFWLDYVLPVLAGILLVYIILVRTGTLTSGYHFADDHELIRMEVAFSQDHASFGEVLKTNVITDLNGRYRPFYWLERTLQAYLFGSNLFYWNCVAAAEFFLAVLFLYFTFRYLQCSPAVSAVAMGLSLLGDQITPWYRSANQENLGFLLLITALFFVAKQEYEHNYRHAGYQFAMTAALILCGMTKESFTLVMPAVIMLRFWLEYCDETKEHRDPGQCLKSIWPVYAAAGASFVFDMGMILFYVGVDRISYAGFHADTALSEYLLGIAESCREALLDYIIVGIILIALCVFQILREKRTIGKVLWQKRAIGISVIGWFIILSQLVAHAKSGMRQRYIIPWIVGYVLLVMVGLQAMQKAGALKYLYVFLLCALLLRKFFGAVDLAKFYTRDGMRTNALFTRILDHTDAQDQIIGAFYAGELNLATECWMETHGRTQTCSYDFGRAELFNWVQLLGDAPEKMDWSAADAALCYDEQKEDILMKMQLTDPSEYAYSTYGYYAVIIRNEK